MTGFTEFDKKFNDECDSCHEYKELVGILNGSAICEPCLSDKSDDGTEGEG